MYNIQIALRWHQKCIIQNFLDLGFSGIIYCCLICNAYEVKMKDTMKSHLRKKHSDLLGNNINWDSVFGDFCVKINAEIKSRTVL